MKKLGQQADMYIEREFNDKNYYGTFVFDIYYSVDGTEVLDHWYELNTELSTILDDVGEIFGDSAKDLLTHTYMTTTVDTDFYAEILEDWEQYGECAREYRED